jgi:hypothetical protein
MTDAQPGADRSVKAEAVQAVVDRITSWQDGATEETVRQELLQGLSDAQLDVPPTFVDEVVRRVRDNTEHFDVGPLLTATDGD